MSTITLEYSKSTKGTHVYSATEDDAPIPTLYIRKSFFSEEQQREAPPEIQLTIEIKK